MPRYRRRPQPRLRHRTKKAVLNTTSTKKRDVMLPVTNQSVLGAPLLQVQPASPIHVRGGEANTTTQNGAFFIWSPTQRPINDNTVSENSRSTRDVYHKGFRERIKVESSSSAAWVWRRIVVETKEDDFSYDGFVEGGDTSAPPREFRPWYLGPAGVSRLWYNQYGNKLTPGDNRINPLYEAMVERLFEGSAINDWLDTLAAKVDVDRYKLRYDKTFTLRSNNDDGFVKYLNFYFPFESTMYYDHDESGSGTGNQSVVCTPAKKGMGNVYIIDIVEGAFSSDDTDILRITPEACAYWHER